MRLLVVALCCTLSDAWVTISQSRFGAQISTIRDMMHIPENGTFWRWPNYHLPDQQLLGYLWNMPEDPLSHVGLGGGITYAWDPNLCDALLPRFREDFFFMPFVDCVMLKAAMARGFHSWSANNARISFVDVTDECDHIGDLTPTCELAELWITALNSGTAGTGGAQAGQTTSSSLRIEGHEADTEVSEVSEAVGGATTAALAQPTARYATNFRYTNGVSPSSGRVIETYGGVISFNPLLC